MGIFCLQLADLRYLDCVLAAELIMLHGIVVGLSHTILDHVL